MAKRPNPTDLSWSANAKKVKLSQEKLPPLATGKGRPGPAPDSVATIFTKAKLAPKSVPKPVPSVPAPEPQHSQKAGLQPVDVHHHHDTETLPLIWSDDGGPSASDDNIEPEDGVVVNPNGLVQLSHPKKKAGRRPGGAPRNDLMDQLLMYCYSKADGPDAKKWGCIGRCGRTWTIRNFNRVLKHASECRKLTTDLRELARDKSAEKAPSQKLENRHEAEEPKTMKLGPNKHDETSYKLTVFNSFQKKGKADRDEAINLAIIKFICAAGLPTLIVLYQE